MLSFSANPTIDQQQQQQQQQQQNNQLATQLANQLVNQQNALQQTTQQTTQPGQTMRLRDDGPPINPSTRTSRKRKSPPSNNTSDQHQQQPQQPQQQQQPPQQQQQQQQPLPPPQAMHILPPPHAMMHTMQGPPPPLPPGYSYADYTPGGMPPAPPQPPADHQHHSQSPPPNSAAGRALSSSKRAEQNRKAQRAFRERRDQHVKALESRSQLLDAALASADEANRRWEECRALVDQLRVENAALRAALSQAQLLPPGIGGPQPANTTGNIVSSNGNAPVQNNGAHQEGAENLEGVAELKNDSAETPASAQKTE